MIENMEWYSVMFCIGFATNITLCNQDKKLIALSHVLQYYFSALLQTGYVFWNIVFLYRLPSFHSVNWDSIVE